MNYQKPRHKLRPACKGTVSCFKQVEIMKNISLKPVEGQTLSVYPINGGKLISSAVYYAIKPVT